MWFSPTVNVFLNLPEILDQMDVVARRFDEPTAFYLGKLQDGEEPHPLVRQWRILKLLTYSQEEFMVKESAALSGMCEKTVRRDLIFLQRGGSPAPCRGSI